MLIEQCPFINNRSRLDKFLHSKYATCVSTSSFSEHKNDYYKLDKDGISWELSRIDFQREWQQLPMWRRQRRCSYAVSYADTWRMGPTYVFQGKSWFCDHTRPRIQSTTLQNTRAHQGVPQRNVQAKGTHLIPVFFHHHLPYWWCGG